MIFRNQITKKRPGIEEMLQQIVGHVVVCEDGVFRRVVNACSPASKKHAQMGLIIINEGDPQMPSGHWVSLLSCQLALEGLPQPDKEQRAAFKRIAMHTRAANLKSIYEANRTGKGKLPFEFE